MANNNGNSDIKLGIGFVMGMAVGLAIGFIYAPREGGETREIIREKVLDTGEKVKEIATDVGATVQGFAADVNQTVQEAVGDRKKIYKRAWKQPKVKPYNENL
jgi:gas vesicle protein